MLNFIPPSLPPSLTPSLSLLYKLTRNSRPRESVLVLRDTRARFAGAGSRSQGHAQESPTTPSIRETEVRGTPW